MSEEILTTAGGVRIVITGDGSGFSAAVAEANKQVAKLQGSVRTAGEVSRKELGEARGAAAVLGEELGVHLPRHVRNFIAEMPGVSSALSAAFNTVAIFAIGAAIIEAGQRVAEFVGRTRESAEKLKEAHEGWGDAVERVSRTYQQKMLQAGIETDDLAGNHVAALQKQLELIDMQGFDNLGAAFKQLEASAQNTFQNLKASWIDTVISFITTGQLAAGSSGVAGSEQRFASEYNRRLNTGDSKGAQGVLDDAQGRESAVLFLMKSALNRDDPRGAKAAGTVLDREYNVKNVDKKAYEAEQQFVAELQQLRVAVEKQTALTDKTKGNAVTKTDMELAEELRRVLDQNLRLMGDRGSPAAGPDVSGFRARNIKAQQRQDAEMLASPYIYMPSKDEQRMFEGGPADLKGAMSTFSRPAPNVSLTAMGQLNNTVRDLASQFTNLGQVLSQTVTRELSQFNDVLAGMISGKHGSSFAKMGQEMSDTVVRGGLQYAEGTILKSLGFGGKKGDSASNPLFVSVVGAASAAGRGVGAVFSGIGKMFHLPGFAAGGSIASNMAAIVGENGPEIFMPSSSGKIVPNHELGGLGGVHIDARGSTDEAAVEARLHRAMRSYVDQVVPGKAIRHLMDFNARRPRSSRI